MLHLHPHYFVSRHYRAYISSTTVHRSSRRTRHVVNRSAESWILGGFRFGSSCRAIPKKLSAEIVTEGCMFGFLPSWSYQYDDQKRRLATTYLASPVTLAMLRWTGGWVELRLQGGGAWRCGGMESRKTRKYAGSKELQRRTWMHAWGCCSPCSSERRHLPYS